MTTVADGLYQFGGSPVGTSLLTTKIFSTLSKGRAWFVDPQHGSGGNGRSPKNAFTTMQAAFNSIQSGDIIYFVGKITEQLVCPVQVFDVTVVGCGNRPRHADAVPEGGNYAGASWAAPASPVAGQALVRVIQQGWTFVNILFAGLTGAGSIELGRNGGAGDLERDASHASILQCRFAGAAGAGIGVKFGGVLTDHVFDVLIAGNTFQDNATAIEGATTNSYRLVISDNNFQGNTNHIVCPMTQSVIKRNIFGSFTTKSVDLSGGQAAGLNCITANYFTGTYSSAGGYTVSAASDEWAGNNNSLAGGITAADPA